MRNPIKIRIKKDKPKNTEKERIPSGDIHMPMTPIETS
jgi:hypothetical protein